MESKVNKSWFTPRLKSKYLTIELLKICFKNKYEVIAFLRSLCKKSESFLDRFGDEFMEYFTIYEIQV